MAVSDYKFDVKLGDKVNLAHIKMSKQAVAIKSYKKDEENVQYILIEKRVSLFTICQETLVKILLTSTCQYIPKLLSTFETEDTFYLVQSGLLYLSK